MAIIVDTGFLYALMDRTDKHHAKSVAFLQNLSPTEQLILPTLTMVEITYFLLDRLGHEAMRKFLAHVEASPYQFEPLQASDMRRIHEVLEKYADSHLDFVDAFIVALAERLKVTQILTVDVRHFRTLRPLHCDYFEILP
jgi:uncharacterized protein